MMNICPNPVRWNAVYEALMLECSRRGIPSAPPRPLILAGWAYSNDVEKADCWKATIDWAEQYGISEITRIEPKDWYCVDHPSSLEIGPFGGPTFLPWRFEPAEPPNPSIPDYWEEIAQVGSLVVSAGPAAALGGLEQVGYRRITKSIHAIPPRSERDHFTSRVRPYRF
jgi:hypothetical protein